MPFKSQLGQIFRNSFSERIFTQKYRHDGALTWEELATTLANDVVQDTLSADTKKEIARIIREGKFIPGGRYLYYAGRKRKFYNNCLTGDHRVLTKDGYRRLDELFNKEVLIYSPYTHRYVPARIYRHGRQDVNEITFKPIRSRSTIEYKIKATPRS